MNPKITVAFVAMAIAFAGCKTKRPAFKPARAKTQITELHMLNARDGWAWSGGLPGQNSLLRTHDGGMSWRDVTPRGFSQIEEGACFRDARTAWIPIFNRTNVTAGLLHTTDGGKSWSLLNRTNTPFFNDASSCRFYSSTYGVGNSSDNGAGSAYVTFFETHDSGKTWSQIPFTPRFSDLAESNTFHLSNIGGDRIAFYPPASVMITYGDTADEKPKGFVRFSRTTDLGKNWRDMELPLPKQFEDSLCVVPFGPVFVDKQNIVLAAHVFESTSNSYSNGALIFYTSHDGGATWFAREGMIALKQPWYTVKVVSPKCFFVANGPDICVTHDGAQSWQTIVPNISFGGNSKRDIVRMDFVDATHGWLLISDNSQFYPDGKFILYRTADGGKTWSELPVRVLIETR